MTCIAFDGTNLAADMQSTAAGRSFPESKLFTLHSENGRIYHIAFSGSSMYTTNVLLWLGENLHVHPSLREEFPVPMDSKHDLLAVVAYKDESGAVRLDAYESHKYPDSYDTTYERRHAFGSGAQYAMGAMGMGANATTAVKVAMSFDVHCGHGYQSVVIGSADEPAMFLFETNWNADVVKAEVV